MDSLRLAKLKRRVEDQLRADGLSRRQAQAAVALLPVPALRRLDRRRLRDLLEVLT